MAAMDKGERESPAATSRGSFLCKGNVINSIATNLRNNPIFIHLTTIHLIIA